MKKIFGLVGLALWLFAMEVVAYASERTILRVGYVPNTGFLSEDYAGHLTGYGFEYMEFLSRYGDWSFEYVPCFSWAECGQKLQSGEIDLLPGMPGNYKTLTNVVRTDHVIGRFPMEIITKDGKSKPFLRLGNITANGPLPSLPLVAKSEGFEYQIVMYPLFYDMADAFDKGEIDGYIDPMLEPYNRKNVLAIFDRQSYRMLLRPDRKELLDKMNAAMDQMLLDQPSIRDRLNDKYLRSGGFPLILSKSEWDYLEEKKKLHVAILMRAKPYAYMEDGKLKGIIPSVVEEIGKDLGIEIEIVETQTPSEAAHLMQQGNLDFIADTPCDFSFGKKMGMAPTQAYLSLDYVMVKRKDEALTDNSIVACDEDLLYAQRYIFLNFPEERRLLVKNLSECFRAVSGGNADVLFAPRGAVNYIIEDVGAYNLEVDENSDFTDSISIGVNINRDSHLWRILNREVNHLDVSKIRHAVNADMSGAVHISPQWFIYHYPLRAVGILIVITLLIIGFFVSRAKMRQRHTAIVQHMAYTDSRYNIPNLAWLEEQVPKKVREVDREREKVYVAVFAMERRAALTLPYGKELLVKQLQKMAEQLFAMDWVLLTAAGSDAGSLVCIVKGRNEAEVQHLVQGAVAKYGYAETAEARVWLHMRAGLCLLNALTGDAFHASIESAVTACQASQGTGGSVRVFDAAMQENITLAQRIEVYMEKALKGREFQAWFQPKYDIKTHRLTGAEALVRWQSVELGFLPPGKFIPLFESNGFVIPLDYFLLEETCRFQRKRLDEGKPIVPISVNQSRLHMTEEDYIEKLKNIVKKYHLPPGYVELEVTETIFGDFDHKEQRERASSIIHAIKDMGFKVSVDDFGSGYSSYTLLNHLPMDVMKIDRSLLVATDDGSTRMRDILGNIIQLGHTLHMQVICEGIETPEQEKLLLELGCNYGQGFFFGKPMPQDDFVKFWEKKEAEYKQAV